MPGSNNTTTPTVRFVQLHGSDHKSDSVQHDDPPVLTLMFVSQIKLNLEPTVCLVQTAHWKDAALATGRARRIVWDYCTLDTSLEDSGIVYDFFFKDISSALRFTSLLRTMFSNVESRGSCNTPQRVINFVTPQFPQHPGRCILSPASADPVTQGSFPVMHVFHVLTVHVPIKLPSMLTIIPLYHHGGKLRVPGVRMTRAP